MSKITQSAKGEECTLRHDGCRWGSGTVVFSHLDHQYAGKGMGIKATKGMDWGFYACDKCHAAYARHEVDASDVLRAVVLTQQRLIAKGLIGVK